MKFVGRINREEAFFIFLGFLLFAIALRKLWAYPMLSYGDATPFPNNFHEAFQFFFGSFDPRTPGIFMPQASVILSTLVPLEAFLALLFGGSFLWAQKIFYLLPIPLSFVTIYFLVSKFTLSKAARFVTAFIYSSNHFMVGEFAGGFAGNLYIPALFPLLVYALFRLHEALTKREKSDIIKCSLIYSFLQAIAYVLSDHVLILLVPFWLIFIFAPLFVSRTNSLGVFRNLLILISSYLISLLLTAYHAYGYLKIALPFLNGRTINQDLMPFFVQNLWDTYWKMTLANSFRLGGSYFIDFYQGNQIWARLGFIIPLLAFSWFLFRQNRKGLRFKMGLIFSIAAVFTAVFIYLTGQGVTHPLFKAVPALFRFRNPSRLSLFLAFLYSPLIALTLDGWFSFISRLWSKGRRPIFFLCSLVTLLLVTGLAYYHKGFFSGDFTLQNHRGDSFWIKPRLYHLSTFLAKKQKEDGPFRVAHFPWNHESAEVQLFWTDPYALGVPIEYGAYIRNDYLEFIEQVYRSVSEEKLKDFGLLLNKGGVKFVVLDSLSSEFGRAQYSFAYHVPWLDGSYGDLSRIINARPDLRLVADVEGYKIYENYKFDRSLIDLKKAGLVFEGRENEDRTRRFLIVLTAFSWLVCLIVYFRLPPLESSQFGTLSDKIG